MNSKEFINEVKDDVSVIEHKSNDSWCIKEEDALKAIDMAKEEAKQEVAESTLYSIKKGDFVTIYNSEEDKYVDGKIDRITKSAFYFSVTTSQETVYSRDKWSLKIEI